MKYQELETLSCHLMQDSPGASYSLCDNFFCLFFCRELKKKSRTSCGCMEEECSILKNNRCMTQMCLWNSREINVVGTVRNWKSVGRQAQRSLRVGQRLEGLGQRDFEMHSQDPSAYLFFSSFTKIELTYNII